MELHHKITVVTGASSGVGRALVRALAGEGAKVGLIARNRDGLEAAAREVRELGSQALVLPLDVSGSKAVDSAADQVVERWGQLDVWINCAMVSVFAPVDDITADEFQRVTSVNYLGYVNGTRAALRHMRERDTGSIMQIGSALAYRSIPLQSAYCASKAAIRGFTDSLRSELIHQGSGITVTMLQLPAVNTPQFEVVRNRMPDHPQPVPPIYQPEVIARAAIRALRHPQREVWIGWPVLEAIVGQRLIPGLLDRYLANHAWDQQTTRDVPAGHPLGHAQDNVDTPLRGDLGAHGIFDSRARPHSVQQWLRAHAPLLAFGGLAVLGVGAGLRRSRHT